MIARWRQAARARFAEVDDLLRVLFKRRNGQAWSDEDRSFLRRELRALARWTPALFLFLLPGSLLLLPAYAWLLDHRRGRAAAQPDGRRAGDRVTSPSS